MRLERLRSFNSILQACPAIQPKRKELVPHMTLGQCSKADFSARRDEFLARRPLPWTIAVKELALISRTGASDPFVVTQRVALERRPAAAPRVWSKKDKNIPAGAVYVGRPSKYGNPFKVGRRLGCGPPLFTHSVFLCQMQKEDDRDRVCEQFEDYMASHPDLVAEVRRELKGKHLICFCAPRRCHADTLLRIANS